ncbi:MAG TPA: efflux RND transporter periplasmic adaptor subunit, partial [Caulobacteraceae bacterium]|nr:efflux RND transporter periplasmic adaptor subunit [Caulobacteraceae bacterium]
MAPNKSSSTIFDPLLATFQPKKQTPTERPAVPVNVAQASLQDVPVVIFALGAVQAWQSDLIKTQVNGKLLKVTVAEGAFVKAGQVLAQVDPAPYRATLMQAQGALARDSAILANARLDLKRYQALAKTNSIAQQQVDTQAAIVKQDEGLVQIDQGQVAAAQVNVNYATIVSPVSGRVGVRLTDPGNVVSVTDATGIMVVNQLSPIAVNFTVPQGDFQRLLVLSNGFRTPLKTEAHSQESGLLLDTGELTTSDNRVDPASGTVQLKARFANAKQTLWPGQYVNVRLTVQTLKHVVAIPTAAVSEGPNGSFVYVVGPDRKVKMRPVTVSVTQDATAVIQKGLEAGETVVTDGQVSLTPGARVSLRGAGGPGKGPRGGGG